ncbi:site-specific integrase [Desulfovibrio mangrovi]|uniref:tyrosine-type recombinase/integrase n=1 Tax=Desulfovibrio mangrovi TaxID=2976983 RepID=UPI0022474C24|nr:tyrosine-type recombinase/integrase [Desulfovibrio mangrovi]UZP68748.1 site-specific integrase [Desulfovibrio mangrovi]
MSLRPPFQIPGSPNWYYEINRKRRSLKTAHKAAALRLFNEIKRQYLAGKLLVLSGECPVTLGDFWDEYEEWASVNRPRHTYNADMLALKQLLDICGKTIRLDRLGKKDADKIITACRKRGLKPNSINNYIRHLRSVFNKSVEWNYLKENPFQGVKELRTEKKPPSFLSRADISRVFLAVKDEDLRRLIMAYLATGRRRVELLSLIWEDIDWQGNRYFIRKSKSHLCKWYPMAPAFKTILQSMPRGNGKIFSRWQHPDTITHNVKKALVQAGFSSMRLHDLRHSFACLFI